MGGVAADSVVEFWRSIGQRGWFARDSAIDAEILNRFSELHQVAAAGQLNSWRQSPLQCLALILVLDQFSRNLYRDDGRAFAQDAKAREVAAHAIEYAFDRRVDRSLTPFFYLPFMHSESIVDQERGVSLMHRQSPGYLKFARTHRDVIARFGRFPHRNPRLGRHTTPAEKRFLDAGGFGS